MTEPNGKDQIPIIGRLFQKPPSIIIIGTVIVIGLVILLYGPLYIYNPSSESGEMIVYQTFSELAENYDYTNSEFRSYDSGDTVYIRDYVIGSSYLHNIHYTLLNFSIAFANIPSYVPDIVSLYISNGDYTSDYPVGTLVEIELEIYESQGVENINLYISHSHIQKA